jgi:amino acid transporter
MGVSTTSNQVFIWFYSFTTITSLITWVAICVAYLRFYAAMRAQGIDRATLPFRAPFQPYATWFALIYFLFIILTNGFAVFLYGNWNVSSFLVAYLNIPYVSSSS